MSDESETTDQHASISVTIEREFEVPIDFDQDEHAEDYFWTHWNEFLDNEPTMKDDIVSVEADCSV